MKLLAVRALQKGLRLACPVSSDIPGFPVGDLGRLRQLVVNLVGNVIKFTRQGEVAVHVVMARAMVDELLYNEAHNEVAFVKYL